VLPGFPTREELLARYAERSGRDLSGVDFYTAFGYWKLACIIEGVYARYLHGAMGASRDGFEGFKIQVERLAASAAETAGRLT
jgi:aminoglycoside phosphotransferase (APT) family kinase protein